ncbi:hypothetical protein AX16_007296 [Volvariella volvacea WC 439]|nr:hypothetical protein AX16_007296 [Volvariella volvacea WC 439]
MPTPDCTSLLDLPNELLDHILSHTSADMLFKLACLCRSLNAICMVHYLQKSGIRSPTTSITLRISIAQPDSHFNDIVEDDLEVLRALRIAFSLRHIKVLTCSIERSHTDLVPYKLLQVLNGLYDLVGRLDFIKHARLFILGTECYPTWYRYPGLGETDAARFSEAREWAKSYGRLLNALMKKSSNVELSHGLMPFHAHQLVTSLPSPTPIFQHLLNLFRAQSSPHTPFQLSGVGWVFRWVDELGRYLTEEDARTISPIIDDNLEVETLTLSGNIMLFPPCINWLPSFFTSSSLTGLTLSSAALAADLWDAVISTISPSLTRLQHLKILRCHNISASSLAKLIGPLSNLQSLEIGSEMESRYTSVFFPSHSFPKLSHISANAQWALSLFRLRVEDVESYVISSGPFDSLRTAKIMHFPSLVTLTILWDGNVSFPWVNSSRTLPIIRFFRRFLRLQPTFKYLKFRSFKYEDERIGLMGREFLPYTSLDGADMLGFNILDVVELQYSSAPALLKDKTLFKEWLGCFPSLKALELSYSPAHASVPEVYPEEYATVRALLITMVREALMVVYSQRVVDLIVDGLPA